MEQTKIKYSKLSELLRFLICGLAAALTDYLASQVIVFIFNKIGITNDGFFVLITILSTAIGFIFGVIVNYIISTFWVYQNVDQNVKTKSKKFISIFVILSFIAMLLSIAAMLLCDLFVVNVLNSPSIVDTSIINLIKENGITFLLNPYFWTYFISFCIKTLVGLIWNYFTRKNILYVEPKKSLKEISKDLDISIKKLSIVFPCYNEGKDIVKNVDKVKEYCKTLPVETEIICISDGSKDNTLDVIKNIDGIIADGYVENKGKGGAVKYGINLCSGDYVLFMDADLSTDLRAIKDMLPLLGKYDVVVGNRHHFESEMPVKQPLIRIFIGKCCSILVNMIFKFKLTDTQCGFKCFKTDLAKKIIQKQQIDKFAFDVEYLYIAQLNGCSRIDIPIIWKDDRSSTVSPINSSKEFLKDILKIKKNKRKYLF